MTGNITPQTNSAKLIKHSSRGRQSNGQPNPIDIHVGSRMRERRELLGISQEKLAALIGVTFQQVQKYERGTNRASASRLWDLSRVLRVDINFFYADMSVESANQSQRMLYLPSQSIPDLEKENNLAEHDPMTRSESISLVKNYYKIINRKLAKSLSEVIRQAAKTGPFTE